MSEPSKMVDLVDYQDGSVVSRTIIKKKTGTVTLFAFAKGEELSEHTAAYDALIHILEGEAEIAVSGTTFRLHLGEMVVLPANAPHAVSAVEPFKMILTMIKS